jgi:hypothetical protein
MAGRASPGLCVDLRAIDLTIAGVEAREDGDRQARLER